MFCHRLRIAFAMRLPSGGRAGDSRFPAQFAVFLLFFPHPLHAGIGEPPLVIPVKLAPDMLQRCVCHAIAYPLKIRFRDKAAIPLHTQQGDIGAALLQRHQDGPRQEVIGIKLERGRLHRRSPGGNCSSPTTGW